MYRNQIKQACAEQDARFAAKIVDNLRYRYGYNYEQILELFKRYGNITADDFELLMNEADAGD